MDQQNAELVGTGVDGLSDLVTPGGMTRTGGRMLSTGGELLDGGRRVAAVVPRAGKAQDVLTLGNQAQALARTTELADEAQKLSRLAQTGGQMNAASKLAQENMALANKKKDEGGGAEDAGGKRSQSQDHHAIPWDNKTWKHQDHPLVKEAGNPNLKTLGENLRALEGHAGRHSPAYHQEIRRRLDEAYVRVKDRGEEAALAELKNVINGIWNDIASGKLKPYSKKDVNLPP